jgi:serine/threonine protein kinase
MGRLGDHPHIVPVYDIGEEGGRPYLVIQLMGGGEVEGLIEQAPDHRVPNETALKLADESARRWNMATAKASPIAAALLLRLLAGTGRVICVHVAI